MNYKGRRITKSLRTKDRKVAIELKPFYERTIIDELTGIKTNVKNLSFRELTKHFLNANHNWATSTLKLNRYVLSSYIKGKTITNQPYEPCYIFIRVINQCWNYGLKNHLILKADKIPGYIIGEPRQRTYTDNELNIMFEGIRPHI